MLKTKKRWDERLAELATRGAGLMQESLETARSAAGDGLSRVTKRNGTPRLRRRLRRLTKRDVSSRMRRRVRRGAKRARSRLPIDSVKEIPRPVLVGVGVAVVAAGAFWAIRARKRRRRGEPSQSEVRELIAANSPGTRQAS